MNWLSNITRPGIKNIFKRQDDAADALWDKCKSCGSMIFQKDLEAANRVCPSCDHHMALSPEERLALVFDDGACERIDLPEVPADPLKFRDTKRYADRLREHRRKTGEEDAILAASGQIEGVSAVICVQNFGFMGGSMGMAVGEGFIKAAEEAVRLQAPLIMFTASGGARMQESILALMQMPRTTIAVQMLREAGLPLIVVLTNPTTGGVMASFAMLGDIHIAEPGAVLGFAGRRVIEQTIRESLPDEFQTSEFLLEKGMVDIVVHRRDLRATLARLLRVLVRPVQFVADANAPATETDQEIAADQPDHESDDGETSETAPEKTAEPVADAAPTGKKSRKTKKTAHRDKQAQSDPANDTSPDDPRALDNAAE